MAAVRWLAGAPDLCSGLEHTVADLDRAEGVTWVRLRDARRRLARVDLAGGGSCFLKHYLRSPRHPFRERLKRWLRLTSAEREWRTLVRLRSAGLAVPEPLAHARLASGEHVIAMQWIDGASLAEALAAPPAERRALLAALGAVVRSLHAAGWSHRDLHRENVLVGPHGPLLIDLQAALPTANAAARRRDLGELDSSLRPLLSICDRVRLRAAALGVSRPFDRAAREALCAVGRSSRVRARAHARSRAARSLRAGRRAQTLRCGGGSGLVARTADTERVRAALAPGAAEAGLELRRYPGRWSDLWRGSAARRAWTVAHALEACDVPRVPPVAFVEWRRLAAPMGSALVLEATRDEPADAAERADAAARLWTRLLESGFDTAGFDAAELRFERADGGRLVARVSALERLRFPRRPAAFSRPPGSSPSGSSSTSR